MLISLKSLPTSNSLQNKRLILGGLLSKRAEYLSDEEHRDLDSIKVEVARGKIEIDWSIELRTYIPDLLKMTLSAYVVFLLLLLCCNADWYYVTSVTAVTLACLASLGILSGRLVGHAVRE